MADVLMGVTETSAAALDVISSRVQEYLQQESKMLPLVSNFSDLVVPGSKQVEIPRSGGFTVNSKSENTAVDAQAITYSTDSIALDQHKVIQWLIEDIASEQTVVRVVEDALMKAGKDMARDIDQALINRLEAASAAYPKGVPAPIINLGASDKFITQNTRKAQLMEAGINVDTIVLTAKKLLAETFSSTHK